MNIFQKISVSSLVFMGATLMAMASETRQKALRKGVGILPIVKHGDDQYSVMMRLRPDGTIGTVGGGFKGDATREKAAVASSRKSRCLIETVILGMGDIMDPVAKTDLYALYGTLLYPKPLRKDKQKVFIPVGNFMRALLADDTSTLVSTAEIKYSVWAPTQDLFKENKVSLCVYLLDSIKGWEGND